MPKTSIFRRVLLPPKPESKGLGDGEQSVIELSLKQEGVQISDGLISCSSTETLANLENSAGEASTATA